MKTNNELIETPGVKGIIARIQKEGNHGRSMPEFTIDQFVWPTRFLPQLREEVKTKGRMIKKLDMRARIDAPEPEPSELVIPPPR